LLKQPDKHDAPSWRIRPTFAERLRVEARQRKAQAEMIRQVLKDRLAFEMD
jgi:hypothetical protein